MSEDDAVDSAPDVSEVPVPPGAVIVGLDGSERDDAVLGWAVGEAERTARPLHLVNARESLTGMLLPGDPSFAPSVTTIQELDALDGSDALVLEVVARVRADHPGLSVTSSRPWGTAAQALLGLSDDAFMIVVGGGRKGAVARLFLGSTALSVAAHAGCPVVVVGPEGAPDPPHGRVVVGVDGSPDSVAAARFAIEEAERRGAGLVCVVVWNVEVVDGYVVTTPGTPAWDLVEGRHREAVEDVLTPLRGQHPNVAIEVAVVHGPRVGTLVDRSGAADLVVLGSRGRGGFAGMLLGSVSQGVLHEAHCPVAVVTGT